jgi:hypothetical protein
MLNDAGEFKQHFGEVLSGDLERLRKLLKHSSMTATTTTKTSNYVQSVYAYNGDTYKGRGAKGKQLSDLALKLVGDYVKETDKTTDEFAEMINSEFGYERVAKHGDAMKVTAGWSAKDINTLVGLLGYEGKVTSNL